MPYCHVSNQIAEYCNQEESYCSECESTVTEHELSGSHWLECDNPQCGHSVDLDERDI